MKNIYLFDVDGTLTPAKSKIEQSFAKDFYSWQKQKEVYIVSGGSFPRIVDQLGRKITDQMLGVFSCMGNAYYKKITDIDGYSSWSLMYKNIFTVDKPKLFFSELERYVMNSDYHTKTGRHYEERVGMVNFSIVGRNATMKERKEYEEYDKENKEREKIVTKLSKKHPQIDFVIGGAVSIDIFNKGNDKGQVIKHFSNKLKDHRIIFVGDRIPFPGNDYSLAEAVKRCPNGEAVEVDCWQDTAALLKTDLFASG
tara:strand:+ start:2506 stop:3267 length:762 start_codon:yes stop_codon:yes gene_type:complete